MLFSLKYLYQVNFCKERVKVSKELSESFLMSHSEQLDLLIDEQRQNNDEHRDIKDIEEIGEVEGGLEVSAIM